MPVRNAIFSGRNDEVEYLMGILSQASRGSGQIVLLSGPAGLGKTRLANEFILLAESTGARTAVGECPSTFTSPLHPFRSISEELGFPLGQCQTSDVEKSSIQSSEIENLIYEILEGILNVHTEEALLIGIDDVHWADTATVDMLRLLAPHIPKNKIMLLLTARIEETSANAALTNFLGSVREPQSNFHELTLNPLTINDIRGMLESVVNGSLDDGLLERICIDGGGNPLFLIETLKMLMAEGRLKKVDERWTIAEGAKYSAPSTVRDVISRRLRRFSDDDKAQMEGAAIIGRTIDPKILAGLTDKGQDDTLAFLDRIANDHQLIEHRSGRYQFSHELIRNDVLERMDEPVKVELHRKAGAILESLPRSDAISIEIARHQIAAREQRSISSSITAGRICMANSSYREAEPFFQHIITSAIPGLHDHIIRDAQENLGDVRRFQFRMEEASDIYQGLLSVISEPNARVRMLRKQAQCWGQRLLGKGDDSKAESLLNEALNLDVGEDVETAMAMAIKADMMVDRGEFESAKEIGLMAERISRRHSDVQCLIKVLGINSVTFLSIGDVLAASPTAEELVILAEAKGTPRQRMEAYDIMTQVTMHKGQWKEAVDWAHKSVSIAEMLNDIPQQSFSYLSLANVFLYSKDYQNAISDAIRGFDAAAKWGSKFLMSRSKAQRSIAEVHLGQLELAKEHATEAINIDAQMNWKGSPPCGILELMKAEIALAEDDWELGERLYLESLKNWKKNAYSAQHKAFELREYGAMLLKKGRRGDAERALTEAISMYKRLGDSADIVICENLLNT